jgi:monofunctional biosynthetic peptidoglycan transglycosylase
MGSAKAFSAGRWRPRLGRFRLLRWLAGIVVAVLLLPYLIVPFYHFGRPVSTLMMWRWLTGASVTRRWVPLDRMAPILPLTVIVAEDGRYCFHHGVDFGEIREVLAEADDITEARGGSTITQQVAKNLFLWQGRSFLRKALELPLALWIDLVLGKRRTLEIYLNIAEWGPNGQFGAEAGSRWAFRKSIRALDAREAARLTAILPNPIRRSARQPGVLVRKLAGIYLRRARAHPRLAACVRAAH